MTDQNAQQEPSMEEILASIRRIISEEGEEGEGGAQRAHAPEPRPPAGADKVLELTDMVQDDGEVVSLRDLPPAEPEPQPEVVVEPAEADEDEIELQDAPEPPEPAPALEDTEQEATLMSDAPAAEATRAFASLMEAVAPATPVDGGITIEQMLRELLRPMLKEWLDRHLPEIVERMVAIEIERVVGRRRE